MADAARTVITDAGITACINAGLQGPLVKVTSVKVGSSIINPSSTMTDVTSVVWEGDSSFIQYQLVDERTFLFKVTLDESIGDFNIGNIGLFLEDGTLFTISTLISPETKIANNATTKPAVIGNRKSFEIPISLAGISGAIDINPTIIIPDESSIPFLQTEEGLPNYQTASFSAYSIIYHTGFKTAAIALRTPNGWQYVTASTSDSSSSFNEGMFDSQVQQGDLVYFDAVSSTFKLADGLDLSKGYIGIRGSANNIINTGAYVNSKWSLTPGLKYFADTNGSLTSVANNYLVGIAIDKKTLLLDINNETVNNKSFTLDINNPSNIKYPTESAIVHSLNDNFAKVDMSNVGDVTFTGTVTFAKTIIGECTRADWGDLAEFYYADNIYPKGTLVTFGGTKEITIAKDNANAVITSNPAYLMNNVICTEDNVLPIALIGRVPVRVIGKLNKFDKITLSSTPGVAEKASTCSNIIGIALEDKVTLEEGLVLCSVKLTF